MKNLMGLLFAFIVIWGGLTAGMSRLPVPAWISEPQHRLLLFFCLGCYVFLASSLSRMLISEVVKSGSRHVVGSLLMALLLFVPAAVLSRGMVSPPPILAGVQTALLLFGATVLGAVLSTAVKRVGELVPLCCTAAIADLTSVAFGPTSVMVADISSYYTGGMVGPPPLVDSIILKAGMPGYAVPVPLFGVTDWILVSLLSASLLRLRKSDNLLPQKFWAWGPAFFSAAAMGLYAGLFIAWTTDVFIPAMVAIVLVFLALLVWRYDVFRKMEKKDIAYCFILPISVAVVMFLFSQYKNIT
ncbi:MAG TPA: hypothetical protein VJ969_06235 [Desulfopila sp.]|nr:hypothetical protein [Desulfopila sp.]